MKLRTAVTVRPPAVAVSVRRYRPGTSVPSEQELIAFCREHMARFKVPKTVVFGPLPKTSTGKIQKFVLREQARDL